MNESGLTSLGALLMCVKYKPRVTWMSDHVSIRIESDNGYEEVVRAPTFLEAVYACSEKLGWTV